MKVRAKFYAEPARESAAWARSHAPDLAAPLPGLPPQALPATMPSLDFRLVWHTGGHPREHEKRRMQIALMRHSLALPWKPACLT